MANARIDFVTDNISAVTTRETYYSFSIPISDSATRARFTFDSIPALAHELKNTVKESTVRNAIENRLFYTMSPVNFSLPIDDEEPDILDHRFTTIDYGGLYCASYSYASNDILCSAGGRSIKYGAEIVKNLNVSKDKNGAIYGGSPNLKEFYGNITMGIEDSSPGTGKISLFDKQCKIQKVAGDFKVKNIRSFSLCTGDEVTPRGAWFNVIDIRDVDTSSCTTINLLNNYPSPCTIILGNFSNENVTNYDQFFMANAPSRGRILVMTTPEPPKLKNCAFSGTTPKDAYSSKFDWVAKGKIELIRVPKDYLDAYKNNTYIENGTVGTTGWSRYKDIIFPYDPEKEFLPKKEGGENGRTVWIYRKRNR